MAPKHMKKWDVFLFIVSVAFLIFTLIIDVAFYYNHTYPTNVYGLREFMLVFSLAYFGNLISRQRYIQEKNILFKLKSLFFAVLGVYLTIAISKLILPFSLSFASTDLPPLFSSLKSLAHSAFISFFATLFLIAILFILRDLIFYKSKKNTRRLFAFSLVLLGVYILYEHIRFGAASPDWSFQGHDTVEWILVGGMLASMILLSFRTAWVNYLNKKQKIVAFWAGVFILPGAIALSRDSTYQSIYYFSLTIGAFDAYVAYFLYIYISFSLVSLLLHLPTASIFDKKMNEIASLHNLSRVISSVLDYNTIVRKVTELTSEVLQTDFCWLEMLNEKSDEVAIVSQRGLTDFDVQKLRRRPKDGLTNWIVSHRESVLINEVPKDARARNLRFWRRECHSLLGIPLISKNRVIGVLYAGKKEEFGFDHEDREMLQAFANQATVALENAKLVQESIEKERLAQELRVAHDTQLKLLPKKMPTVPGLEVDGLCITANEVGGDYYGFIPLGEEKLGVAIGDVSGKGISAAFFMAELKGILEASSGMSNSAKELLVQMNKVLYPNTDRQTFISFVYAIFDRQKREITLSRAGHCPVLRRSEGRVEILRPEGMALALEKGPLFEKILEEVRLPLIPGDVYVFYTDGLPEARNEKGEEFGDERLIHLLENLDGLPAEAVRERIVSEVLDFIGKTKPHDDLSLLVVRVTDVPK